MDTITEKLSSKFNIEPHEDGTGSVENAESNCIDVETNVVRQPNQQEIENVKRRFEIDSDYILSRNTLRDSIEKGQNALDGALRTADETGNPRAYEVVGGLLRNLGEITRNLLEVQERISALDQKSEIENPTQQIQNNTVFVGSTHELLEMFNNKKLNDE